MNNGPAIFCKALMAITGCALMAAAQAQSAGAEDASQGARLKFAPVPGLSQPEIAACSEEIRRMQVQWTYWPGEAGEAVARLGRIQKELFEGRCAGHPQAQAYVTAANRMLTHANGKVRVGSSGDAKRPRPSRFPETK